MSETSISCYQEFWNIEKEYEAKYGPQTILFYQVGSFFEMYSSSREPNDKMTVVCDFCHLHISEKSTSATSPPLYMAGFRDYTLEKYLARASEHGYTSVVYVQKKTGKQVIRTFQSVHSPGTYVGYEEQRASNYTMSVWFHVVRDQLICGYAVMDALTGHSSLHEFETVFWIDPTTLDELEKAVSVYEPTEIIVLSSWDNDVLDMMLQYCGLKSRPGHRIDVRDKEKYPESYRATQQKYQIHQFERYFGTGTYHTCAEFHQFPIATQAYCYLLHFMEEHHPSLVQQLTLPNLTAQSSTDRVLLANHTLKQLNVLSNNPSTSIHDTGTNTTHSLVRFLDRCITTAGKRLHHQQLTQPTCNKEWLQTEYNMITDAMSKEIDCETIRGILRGCRDLDKVARQIVTHKVYPSTLVALLDTLSQLERIPIPPEWNAYFMACSNTPDTTIITETLYQYLNVEEAKKCNSWSGMDQPVMLTSCSPELTRQWLQYDTSWTRIKQWKQSLNDYTGLSYDVIRIHETEKSGISFQITKTRAKVLKQAISTVKGEISPGTYWSEIRFIAAGANNEEIVFPALTEEIRTVNTLQETLTEENKRMYEVLLTTLSRQVSQLHRKSKWMARLDLLLSKALIAREYRYVCPVLDHDGCSTSSNTSTGAWLKAEGLRHPLLEHLNTQEIYVPNDVALGRDEPTGWMLYGHNTSGKTSLLRAVGVAVIMAQSGWFVPCTSFHYNPFRSIYSRILSNDNLFKNMSSFAVEMSELRVILKDTDAFSLVLADELCHSTEQESALSLVVATLTTLAQHKCCYFMTSHFHEIPLVDEVSQLVKRKKVALRHLHVAYDQKNKKMVLERKVREGTGSRSYGLEIARSLKLPEEFLQQAFAIRSNVFDKSKGTLSFPTSRYNSEKVRGMCEECHINMAEETHHENPQRNADKDGFIGSFHKNHVANLRALCSKCHDKQH